MMMMMLVFCLIVLFVVDVLYKVPSKKQYVFRIDNTSLLKDDCVCDISRSVSYCSSHKMILQFSIKSQNLLDLNEGC